ncbi:PadR family transcriptional regulator [Ilumatobacter sp.]|uniref:PadR family transcriptional regulator n=1 Tax=Ilumatobacter sp. TaxID=1967498 RepID=UPI003AF58D2A
MPEQPLALADHACLALIAEGPVHGWAIVKLLAPDGDVGRIWSLSRPLTYRSIDRLVTDGLVERTPIGRRAELRITPEGRRAGRLWRSEPVEHLRDLRTEFLLKLHLDERAGRSSHELVRRQVDQLRPVIEALTSAAADTVVDVWRQESARAAQRFLTEISDGIVSTA